MMASVSISEFASLTATTPSSAGIEWDALVERLLTFSERQKKDGPGWSPVIYDDDATRGNENVLAITAAVIDIDHDEPEWGLLNAFEYVAHTTFSHMEAENDPHWRVIIPFSRPVSRARWKDTWRKIQFWLAPAADEACKDESRFYWWPTCQPGAPRDVRHHRGAFLDPSTLRDIPNQQPPLRVVERPVGDPDQTGERPGDRFARETDWSDILRGWRLLSTRGPVRKWERPENGIPKKTPGCSATTGGGGFDVLYVFSSNAPPFRANESYSKFRAYSLLEHGGDDTAAASALGQRYREIDGELSPTVTVDEWFSPAGMASADPTPMTAFLRPISELLAMEEVEPDWLVDQLFTVGSNGWVAAEAKVGKSWTVLELIFALSTGTPFLGRFNVKQPRRVIYIQEEDSIQRVLRRFKKLIRGYPSRSLPSDDHLLWSVRAGFKLDNLVWLEKLRVEIEAFKAEVIVLDVFNRLHGSDDSKQAEMTIILNSLTALTNQYGCSFIVVHHNRKVQAGNEARANQMMRGSSVLAGWSECSLYLRKGREKHVFIVTPESKDAPELDDFSVTLRDLDDDAITLDVGSVSVNERTSKIDGDIVAAVEKLNRDGLDATVQRIATAIGKERSGVQKRMRGLVEEGLLDEDEAQFGKVVAKIYTLGTL